MLEATLGLTFGADMAAERERLRQDWSPVRPRSEQLVPCQPSTASASSTKDITSAIAGKYLVMADADSCSVGVSIRVARRR